MTTTIKESTLPKVSIIMSVFNGEEHLHDAIDSIISQTYTDYEFLIMDDASTDNSYAILKSYAETDARVVLRKNKKNKGLTSSLEILTRRAKGKYIARMDADDLSHRDRILNQVNRMESDPNTGLLGTWVCSLLDDGNPFEIHSFPDNHDWIKRNIIQGLNCLAHGSIMIRHEILTSLALPVWRFRYGQDLDLYLRLINITTFGYVRKVLYYQRAVNSSMSVEVLGNMRKNLNSLIVDLANEQNEKVHQSNYEELEKRVLATKPALNKHASRLNALDSMIFAKSIQGKPRETRLLIKERGHIYNLRLRDIFYYSLTYLPGRIGPNLFKNIVKLKYRNDPRIKYTTWVNK